MQKKKLFIGIIAYLCLLILSLSAQNVAVGKTVYGSSQNEINILQHVADGNDITYWESAPDRLPQFVYIDLGEPLPIDTIELNWGTTGGITNQAKIFHIYRSNDKEQWIPIIKEERNEATTNMYDGLNCTGRYIAVYCIEKALYALTYKLQEFTIVKQEVTQ